MDSRVDKGGWQSERRCATERTKVGEWTKVGSRVWYVPALEGVHELARRVQAAAHQERLLAHDRQGIFQESCLVLDQRRRCHVQGG